MNIARYLDHAVLKPGLSLEERIKEIQIGIDYKSRTVCVQPCDIELAQKMCQGTETEVICVLDFPQGQSTPEAKGILAELYANMGVKEIDMVLNYGYLRSGRTDYTEKEVRCVVEKAHAHGIAVKVIFETSELTPEQIAGGVEACITAGADFVKTSTGFSAHGATREAVAVMLETAKGRIKVKPSGGIRSYEEALEYVKMGAARLGVGSGSTSKICDGEASALGQSSVK